MKKWEIGLTIVSFSPPPADIWEQFADSSTVQPDGISLPAVWWQKMN